MDNPVVRDSDEWNTLDFALHLRCRSSRVNMLQAWNITKAETVSVFSRCSQVCAARCFLLTYCLNAILAMCYYTSLYIWV